MNAYLSTKFEGDENEEIVNSLCAATTRAGFTVTCTNRDFDNFGRDDGDPGERLAFMFDAIEHCDLVILDVTEKGMGLGVEAGYAAALGKPVYAIVHEDADVSPTITILAERIIRFDSYTNLTEQLSAVAISDHHA